MLTSLKHDIASLVSFVITFSSEVTFNQSLFSGQEDDGYIETVLVRSKSKTSGKNKI